MTKEVVYKYPLEKCREIASGFKSKSQWRREHRASYEAARKRKWIDICYEDMDYKGKNKKKSLKIQTDLIIKNIMNKKAH